MAALRKAILALAAFTAVTTAVPAFAQAIPGAFTCSIGSVTPLVRYQGLTEYAGDIIISCTGGNPTLAGVQVPVDNFQVDIQSPATVTSRLLFGQYLHTANGTFPFSEAILVANEAIPNSATGVAGGSFANPNTAGQGTGSFAITQSVCPASNEGVCFNYGTGLGGWGAGAGPATDLTSSYSPLIDNGHESKNYNVWQGYLHAAINTGSNPGLVTGVSHSNSTEIRFDGIPVDPPGSEGVITFRITNIRIDATPFSSAGAFVGPNVTASVTITGTQPPNINGTNIVTIATPTNGIVVPPVTEINDVLCHDSIGFDVFVQEGFASSFKQQTWYYGNNNTYTKVDPLTESGSANFHQKSTQNIFGFPYFSESGWDPYEVPAGVWSSLLDDTNLYVSDGEGTSGTRIFVTINDVLPGVTVSPAPVVGLYGGQTGVFTFAGLAGSPSGVMILLGAVTPNGRHLPTDFSTYDYAYTPTPDPVVSTGAPITWVYEVLYADPSAIETADIHFTTLYTSSTVVTLPPPIATSAVGFGPASPTPINYATYADAGFSGDHGFPRFLPGPGSTPQLTWYLTPCQCDLLFPFVTSVAGYDTGIVVANTSADPYGTQRTPGYVQVFYYLNGFAGEILGATGFSATTPTTSPNGSVVLGNDGGTLSTSSSPMPYYTNSVNTTARSTFQQITENQVAAGDQMVFLLSRPGAYYGQAKDTGWVGAPNFEGYLFTVSGFPYCHGYAFITNGPQSLAEGYLALVIDRGSFAVRGPGTTGTLPTDPSHTPVPLLSPETQLTNNYNN